MALQHTIGKSGSLTGIGLQTGMKTTVTINPAPEDYGIRFIRTDMFSPQEIIADIDNVVDNSRGTCIGNRDARIYSVEHIMSAFAGMGIDNCKVEVYGEEVPLMDGSALPFVDLVKKLGIVEQAAQREFIVIDKPMYMYNKADIALGVFPAEHFAITLMVEYRHPAIGTQHTTMFNPEDYASDFAPARTFVFLSEIIKLREQGLIKGGSLDSALVIQDIPMTADLMRSLQSLFNPKTSIREGKNGFINDAKLHFHNELCRHKAVDLIGDLYLLGKPVSGHVLGARTGHAANIELARKIREYVKKRDEKKEKKESPEFNPHDILNYLPHRYPFLMVDKIVSLEPNKRIVALKNVSFNENYFQGHFPDNPVMPGVLQLEAMAQAGGIMAISGRKLTKDVITLLLGIDKVRYRGQVHPGDILRIEVEMLQNREKMVKIAGKCFVEDALVCEAELLAMISNKK